MEGGAVDPSLRKHHRQMPLLTWQTRHMLARISFIQCFSIPESGAMGWAEGQSLITAEQRQGCAICARKDWLEHCFRVYLWREPEQAFTGDDLSAETVLQSPSVQEELGDSAPQTLDLSTGRVDYFLRTRNEGC